MKFFLFFAHPWTRQLALSACALGFVSSYAQTQSEESVRPAENSTLSAELFYEILLGELNLRQGEPGAGFSLLLDAARRSNDVQLFARSVDIALQARSGDGALMAARAWAQAYPQDRKANLQVLQILLAVNQTAESLEFLKKEITLAPASERALAISLIPRYYSRVSDKKLAAELVQKALDPYLVPAATSSSAWTAIGRLRLANDDTRGALQAAQKGQTADRQAMGPALLALELMGRHVKEAQELVLVAMRQQNTPELAMSYVRVLIELRRYSEAEQQLQDLLQRYPQHAEAWLILGSLQFEQGQDTQAESSLARYVSLAQQDTGNNSTRGITQAQTRRASILARQGKLQQARQLLAELPTRNDDELRGRLMAEVQLLREQRQWQAAFDVLVKANSNHPDLMYEQAMLAEKLHRLDDMELLLRRVIEQDPEYHNAYNALGFSLADRKLRLPEAKALILKALSFAPNDPFILDSLGWVEFRLGNFKLALEHLQKAYADRADPEIAAHLGEVLWQLNRQDEARTIWREGFKLAPDNETLQETLQRLKPQL